MNSLTVRVDDLTAANTISWGHRAGFIFKCIAVMIIFADSNTTRWLISLLRHVNCGFNQYKNVKSNGHFDLLYFTCLEQIDETYTLK